MVSNAGADPIELLVELGAEYRRVREDHDREQPRGATRRRIKRQMDQIAERFERLLANWVDDDQLRQDWQAYLYRGAEQPDRPRFEPPPLFRGRTETDSLLEIYPVPNGYDLFIDDKLIEHHEVPWHLDPELLGPVQIGQWSCREVFVAPPEAVRQLAAFLDQPGARPPTRWAQVLFEDGLIDTDFGLTARGARRLVGARRPAAGGERANFCVLVANSARVRIFTLASPTHPAEATLAELTEVDDFTQPMERARDRERFSEARPGLRREGPHTPQHGMTDRRENHRRDSERHFLHLAVDAAARIWSRFRSCTIVVAAPPQSLGLMRPAIERHLRGPSPHDVVELPRDLTLLAAPALHDAVARAGLMPPRGRRMPERPRRPPNPR